MGGGGGGRSCARVGDLVWGDQSSRAPQRGHRELTNAGAWAPDATAPSLRAGCARCAGGRVMRVAHVRDRAFDAPLGIEVPRVPVRSPDRLEGVVAALAERSGGPRLEILNDLRGRLRHRDDQMSVRSLDDERVNRPRSVSACRDDRAMYDVDLLTIKEDRRMCEACHATRVEIPRRSEPTPDASAVPAAVIAREPRPVRAEGEEVRERMGGERGNVHSPVLAWRALAVALRRALERWERSAGLCCAHQRGRRNAWNPLRDTGSTSHRSVAG